MRVGRKYVYFNTAEFDEFLRRYGLVIKPRVVNIVRGNHEGYIIDGDGNVVGLYRKNTKGIYIISKKTYSKIIGTRSANK